MRGVGLAPKDRPKNSSMPSLKRNGVILVGAVPESPSRSRWPSVWISTKIVVRRILAMHFRPGSGSGPSWLTFLGHAKDSLWSADLFRCESLTLRTHWVL